MKDSTIFNITIATAGVAGLFSVIMLADLFNVFPTISFWENFFAGLIGGAVIIITIWFYIPIISRRVRQSKIAIEASDDFSLTRYLDGRVKGDLRLIIRNLGHHRVDAFYWHLFIPKKLNAELTELAPYGKKKTLGTRAVGEYTHARGFIDEAALFPNMSMELPIRIWLDTTDNRPSWTLRWALNTETGPFPKKLALHRDYDDSAIADCVELRVVFNEN